MRFGPEVSLLPEVSPQHDRVTYWLPSLPAFQITRLDKRLSLQPRQHLPHLVQKQPPLALATRLLKTRLRHQCCLAH
uniref:Uncharacterized protein n=1 Tax=mine drainage metagenome TaxID=410659 RepID=E6QJQ6_9ZZZZ